LERWRCREGRPGSPFEQNTFDDFGIHHRALPGRAAGWHPGGRLPPLRTTFGARPGGFIPVAGDAIPCGLALRRWRRTSRFYGLHPALQLGRASAVSLPFTYVPLHRCRAPRYCAAVDILWISFEAP